MAILHKDDFTVGTTVDLDTHDSNWSQVRGATYDFEVFNTDNVVRAKSGSISQHIGYQYTGLGVDEDDGFELRAEVTHWNQANLIAPAALNTSGYGYGCRVNTSSKLELYRIDSAGMDLLDTESGTFGTGSRYFVMRVDVSSTNPRIRVWYGTTAYPNPEVDTPDVEYTDSTDPQTSLAPSIEGKGGQQSESCDHWVCDDLGAATYKRKVTVGPSGEGYNYTSVETALATEDGDLSWGGLSGISISN
jgi:hypothetical protein